LTLSSYRGGAAWRPESHRHRRNYHHPTIVGDGSLIGMNATVLSGSVLGEQCLVAAAALVRENELFPAQSLLAEGIEHYNDIMQFYENVL
jgi:acetyltransferase-like isoleucine patch superfamily enzyme